MNLKKYYELRSSFLQLNIEKDGKTGPVWVKQLENILNSDIHNRLLGCKIENTHIKVGDVHLETFYEAEVLFSHHYWNSLFADWLYERFIDIIQTRTRRIFVIGYETYIEPVLFLLKDKLKKHFQIEMYYGIYEEPKFTQNAGYLTTETNIRYDDDFKYKINEKSFVFYLCGISTTLNTFREMKEKTLSECKKLLENQYCFSLIQVLPDNDPPISNERTITDFIGKELTLKYGFKVDKKSIFDFDFSYGDGYVYSIKKESVVIASYLVSVKSKWNPAIDCVLCSNDKEKAIISTSETSVIPAQMIKNLWYEDVKIKPAKPSQKKIDLFRMEEDGYFRFWNYLYYGHVDRMDHHYVYYVRNSHLIKAILDNRFEEEKRTFDDICKSIKNDLFSGNKYKQYIEIIVCPSESGNEIFSSAINQHVFGNNAHTISVDPNKEFRSNFATKHSNIVFFLDQAKDNSNIEIRFHYVAKHLVGAETFSRIRSLVLSLMNTHNYYESKLVEETDEDKIKIFSDVIVFLNRNSTSARPIYVRDVDKYYSFIDISVPSIRRYGDACPMCRLTFDVQRFKENSMLSVNCNAWNHKIVQYKAKSIEDAKNIRRDQARKIIRGLVKELDSGITYLVDNKIIDKNREQWSEAVDDLFRKTIENLSGKLDGIIARLLIEELAYILIEEKYKIIDQSEKEAKLEELAGGLTEQFAKIANQRYFRRFYLENHLFKRVKECYEEKSYESAIVHGFLDLYPKPNAEALISFVKVITSPFLYYQEYEKNVALRIVKNITDQFIGFSGNIRVFVADNNNTTIKLDVTDINTYLLLVVCVNCLSKIDSTFLLSTAKIIALCKTVELFDIHNSDGVKVNLLKYGDIDFYSALDFDYTHKIPGFLSCVVNNCKRIICGISGDARAYTFEMLLNKELRNPSSDSEEIRGLMRVLFLENAIRSEKLSASFTTNNIIEKYKKVIIDEIYDEDFKEEIPDPSGKLTFVYYVSSDDDELVYAFSENDIQNNDNDDLKKHVEKCWSLGEKISFDGNNCLIYLCSNSELTSHMFMQISFPDDPKNSKNLKEIRKVLSFSKDILKTLEPDLANNSIQLAISNLEASSLMTSGKILSHGSFSETLALSKTVAFLIKQWAGKHDNKEDKDRFFISACHTISSFMDRCIGFGSIKQYVERYATTPDSKENNLANLKKLKNIFTNCCLPINCLADKNDEELLKQVQIGRGFLKEYLLHIRAKNLSKYWEEVALSKTKNNYCTEFIYNDGKEETIITTKTLDYIDRILDHIYRVDIVPCFLNSASYEEAFDSIFLIGVLDVLLRNVFDHSDYNSITKIVFKPLERSYEFTIINGIDSNDKTQSGLTKKFFDDINSISHNRGGHFTVSIGNINETSHEAKLIVEK